MTMKNFKPTGGLDLDAVQRALYQVFESEDSDLADQIEAPEDGTPSRFPVLAKAFVNAYVSALVLGSPGGDNHPLCMCGDLRDQHALTGPEVEWTYGTCMNCTSCTIYRPQTTRFSESGS